VVCSVTVRTLGAGVGVRTNSVIGACSYVCSFFGTVLAMSVPCALRPSHCSLPIFVLAARAAATITLASPRYISEPSFVFLEATRRSMRPPILVVVHSYYCVTGKERCRNEKSLWNTLALGTFAVLEKFSALINIPVPTSSPPVAPSICSHGFSFSL
jgi:hypothetical protein